MSEQYRCSECGHFVEIQDDAICDVCNIGKMQHLRYIRGGEGSHWEGCADVHWDCRIAQHYYKDELYLDEDFRMLAKTYPADVSAIGVTALIDYVEALEAELARLQEKLHDEMGQLEIATDLGNKRWLALNDIYENGEKHNANWCKRKAQEGLGIR